MTEFELASVRFWDYAKGDQAAWEMICPIQPVQMEFLCRIIDPQGLAARAIQMGASV
jgi:hypothetical protein